MARVWTADTFYCGYVKKKALHSGGSEWECTYGPYLSIGAAQGVVTREINEVAEYYATRIEVLDSEVRKGTVTWETIDPAAEKKAVAKEKRDKIKRTAEEKIAVARDAFFKELDE